MSLKSQVSLGIVTILDCFREPRDMIRKVVDGGQEDPFYVLDLSEVVARFRKWKQLMPRVQPFYAVKCNDDKLLVTTLAALGTGFDCASKAEIELVTSLGVRPERIIFANLAKMASHIRHASAAGVHTMTVDSETELIKIKQLMPHAKLVLRIRCDSSDSICLGAKFGCDALSEAPQLFMAAASLGLEVVGVSFHIGSNSTERAAFARGIRAAKTVFTAGVAAGHPMTLVDIGGGFSGRSGEGIQQHAAVINEVLATEFPEHSVRIVAELGRYFAEAAFSLAVMVHSKREIKDTSTGDPHIQYYINDGVFGSFLDVLAMKMTVYPELLKPNPGPPASCSLWGPTCDATDCVLPRGRLPPLSLGDWLVFRDMGAYTITLGTRFNGFGAGVVHAVIDRTHWRMLRDRPLFTKCHFIEENSSEEGPEDCYIKE